MPAIALEIEDRIDHMLDDTRTGDLTILGDMADQHHRRTGLLGKADHRLHAGAYLGNRAGCRFGELAPQGLDGIDDHKVRSLALGKRRQNVFYIGFRCQHDIRVGGL